MQPFRKILECIILPNISWQATHIPEMKNVANKRYKTLHCPDEDEALQNAEEMGIDAAVGVEPEEEGGGVGGGVDW